jgi:hypothetical protein
MDFTGRKKLQPAAPSAAAPSVPPKTFRLVKNFDLAAELRRGFFT